VTAEPGGLLVWVDGDLVPADQAVISVYDRGFRTGEGVFETLRAYGDHVFRLDAHLARARAGAGELGFEPGSARRLAEAVRDTATANLEVFDGQDTALRLTISAGRIDPRSPIPGRGQGPATVVVTSHPLTPSPPAMTAATVPFARELPHVKAVSYLMALVAKRRARELGADEALLTDADDHVLEGASSNVFAVVDGTLVTPPATAELLPGVTRAVVLELAARLGLPVEERPLRREEVLGADEAFLTSTTREIVSLSAVDGRAVGAAPGELTERLRGAYAAEVARERAEGR
jgi:branched-chain amino acid aminotransferase